MSEEFWLTVAFMGFSIILCGVLVVAISIKSTREYRRGNREDHASDADRERRAHLDRLATDLACTHADGEPARFLTEQLRHTLLGAGADDLQGVKEIYQGAFTARQRHTGQVEAEQADLDRMLRQSLAQAEALKELRQS